jgi:heme/copper-type cytochrome/quinol oxidase subunit 2
LFRAFTYHPPRTFPAPVRKDEMMKLPDAQLCGLGHNVLTRPVRVVPDTDCTAWLT